MFIKQISVFLENKKGSVAKVLEDLSKCNIGLRVLSIADTTDFGILRIIADNNDNAKNILLEKGYLFQENDVIGVKLTDEPGGLSSVLKILSNNDVEVEYLYAFVIKSGESACVILRVDNKDKASQILTSNNINLISHEFIANL